MLELRHVTRRYGDVCALDALDLSVPAGELFGFLGPNGAGKTTAMRTIFGITEPEEGDVRWSGAPISAEVRRRFGYLPEERGLYAGMRIGEQLEYLGTLHGMAPADARRETDTWLDRLGLGDRRDDKVEVLSLGNQQRVQLAAALIHRPELLVLDEPFSGLDPVGVETMGQVLADQAASGVTVIFSSHQLDLVERHCRRVAIIDHGRLVASGTVEELTTCDPPVLEIEVDAPDISWADGLPAAVSGKPESGQPGRVRLILTPGTDPQIVLGQAMAAGPVRHFSFERRRLSEVFLQTVGSPA